MLQHIDDTIVAVSSSPGASARAVIRLSGPRAIAFAAAVFEASEARMLAETPGNRRLVGRIRVGDGSVPGEAYIFRAPASYTRQDVVEFHMAGSPSLSEVVLDQLVAGGARVAEAGEFTARAFFHGALDLTRVEGVAAAIAARSDAQLRASQHLLHGGLSRRMTDYREQLADLLALIEAEIDFVEESIDFVSRDEALRRIDAVRVGVQQMISGSVSTERLEMLPEVLLLGPPNAGKSTLFNRLTGTDRAIRSAVAGTTRDVLRAPVTLPGGEIMLCDSAGVEPGRFEQGTLATGLDALTTVATWRAAEGCDLILLVLDATQDPVGVLKRFAAEGPIRSAVIVINKTDQLANGVMDCPVFNAGEAICVSALTGEGVETLIAAIDRKLFSEGEGRAGGVLALTARQRGALQDAHAALVRAVDLLGEGTRVGACAEVLAIEVRDAMSALSLLTGEVTTEDLLGRIFSRFCIGK